MMHVCHDNIEYAVIVVNYGNPEVTFECYKSVSNNKNVCFIVVDNFSSEGQRSLLFKKFDGTPVNIIALDSNVGYFKAINVGLLFVRQRFPNVKNFVIGNNDLVFAPNFFDIMREVEMLDNTYAVISPSITTLDGVSQNPHSIHGITRFREIVYSLYYSSYPMSQLIIKLARFFGNFAKRKDHYKNRQDQNLMLGFGACYILRSNFFEKCHALWAPTFLMGEELMLGRQLEANCFRHYFKANLQVTHLDNITISKTPTQFVWNCARNSHKTYRTFVNPFRIKMRASVNNEEISRCAGGADFIEAEINLKNAIQNFND